MESFNQRKKIHIKIAERKETNKKKKMPGTPNHKILYTRTKPSYCRVANEAKKFEDYDEYEDNKNDGE